MHKPYWKTSLLPLRPSLEAKLRKRGSPRLLSRGSESGFYPENGTLCTLLHTCIQSACLRNFDYSFKDCFTTECRAAGHGILSHRSLIACPHDHLPFTASVGCLDQCGRSRAASRVCQVCTGPPIKVPSSATSGSRLSIRETCSYPWRRGGMTSRGCWCSSSSLAAYARVSPPQHGQRWAYPPCAIARGIFYQLACSRCGPHGAASPRQSWRVPACRPRDFEYPAPADAASPCRGRACTRATAGSSP